MGYLSGMNREQVLLFPESVDECLGENHPVRFIDAYVDRLDLATLGFTHAVPKETGRPGYTPADILQLYIYG
jgi:transposase